MNKVGFQVSNSNKGLHDGHTAVLEFGKTFGEVTLVAYEASEARAEYLLTGKPMPLPTVDDAKLRADAAKAGILYKAPFFINAPENKRLEAYNSAKSFMESYRNILHSEAIILRGILQLTAKKLSPPTTMNMFVHGPEIIWFFWQQEGDKVGFKPREIYHYMLRDKDGLKYSTNPTQFQGRDRLRPLIDGARDRFRVGENADVVKELNASYSPKLGFRLHRIFVYEGGFIPGRLEAVSISYRAPGGGLRIWEHTDFYS